MRLIDADEFVNEIYKCVMYGNTACVDKYEVLHRLNNVPNIDAEPTRHGKWIERKVITDNNDAIEWQSAKCSVCGKYHTTPYMYYFSNYDYCPNCGAKMDLKEVEE